MKQSYTPTASRFYIKKMGFLLLFALIQTGLWAEKTDLNLFVPPPDITISCDYWFPFNANDPNRFISEFDARFGKIASSVNNREKIFVNDRVCPAHPRFSEFAPSSIFDDPCYDDVYSIYWGEDGYFQNLAGYLIFQTIAPDLICGQGDIVREWRYTEPWGPIIGTQRITIINCREFFVPTVCWRFTPRDIGTCDFVGGAYLTKLIEWPCDVVINRCQVTGPDAFKPENLDVSFDQDRSPRMADDRCSMLAATYMDQSFTFIDSACAKIFRRWTVIDWCLYEQFEEGLYFGEYEWKYTQVIKLLNEEGPKWGDCDDRTMCAYGDTINPTAMDQCVGSFKIRPDVTDDCTPTNLLRIDYKIDLNNDGDYDLLGYNAGQAVYPFPNPENLPLRTFPDTLPNADGTYPVGTHRIQWGAEDGCGNISVCAYLLTVEDCKPPTAYCLPGVSTIPMPVAAGGFIDVWANDFDLDSYDNCSAQSDLEFAFSDDPTDKSIRRTCADVTGIAEQLTIYVFDEAGNYSTCLVGLLLTNCMTQQPASVAGTLKSETGKLIKNAMIDISGDSIIQVTVDNGSYTVRGLSQDQNYILTPGKNINPLEGVSTYDLVLISKHILGVEQLNSPYKLISADANKSGSITAFDMIEIRKLVLFLATEFQSNTSWRFVPADYVFNTVDPFRSTFPESYAINGFVDSLVIDFIGTKIGDVNNSAARFHDPTQAEDRGFDGDLILSVTDQTVRAGELVDIAIRAKEFKEILGYQYSLQFETEALDYLSLEPRMPELDIQHFGLTQLDKGIVSTSWNTLKSETEVSSDVLYRLQFRAKKDGRLSDWLQLSAMYLEAEAYTQMNEFLQVRLQFESIQNDITLYQNRPNPFIEQTTIAFDLPEAMEASLSVRDAAGKLLYQTKQDYTKGLHQVDLHKSQLSGAGVLFYTLKTKQATITHRMILH